MDITIKPASAAISLMTILSFMKREKNACNSHIERRDNLKNELTLRNVTVLSKSLHAETNHIQQTCSFPHRNIASKDKDRKWCHHSNKSPIGRHIDASIWRVHSSLHSCMHFHSCQLFFLRLNKARIIKYDSGIRSTSNKDANRDLGEPVSGSCVENGKFL